MMDKASVSDTTNNKLFWKRIWKMRVPNKIKIFLWHACSEALPTKANLFKRKVVNVKICQLCDSENETTLHALWSCQKKLTVWESSFGWVKKEFPTLATFSDLVTLVGRQQKQLELFATVAWGIWGRRNKIRCDELCLPLERIMDSAASILSDFQKQYSHGISVPRQRHDLQSLESFGLLSRDVKCFAS
nr:putative ribonuclease h protein [Quercus suber]